MKILHNKMDKVTVIMMISVTTSLLLSGCFNSSGSNGNNITPPSASTKIATQLVDSKPSDLDDPVALKNDLNRLFGNADDEPTDVKKGDTLSDVFSKAGS